jgi:hypothetical protein
MNLRHPLLLSRHVTTTSKAIRFAPSRTKIIYAFVNTPCISGRAYPPAASYTALCTASQRGFTTEREIEDVRLIRYGNGQLINYGNRGVYPHQFV